LGFSQAYAPFPADSTVWRESFQQWDGPYLQENYQEFHFILGDTTLAGKEYSRLYRTSSPPLNISSAGLAGYMREENKRIYYWNGGLSNEVLLYDFNLGIGDTIYWDLSVINSANNDISSYGVVYDIDSVQITTGEYRKRFHFEFGPASYGSTVIEGIGSTYGLLYPNSSPFESRHDLICMSDVSTLSYALYYINSTDECLFPVVEIDETVQSTIKVFPNPTNNIINLSETVYRARVEIFSATGQKVLSMNDFTGSAINLKDLSAGFYLLSIKGENMYLGKIIKNL